MEALFNIGAAFGLSSSAGLNAYIPLLTVALVARFTDLIALSEPYDTLTNGWVIGVLAVLLVIEMLVDKVPAVDTLNDLIQTFIRPVAGAFLFAASANVITDFNPIVAIIAGVLVAGSVHAVKGTVRPAVTASTAGTGNWLVSLAEDVIAFFVSLLSLIIPVIVAAVLLFVIVWLLLRALRRRRQKDLAFD